MAFKSLKEIQKDMLSKDKREKVLGTIKDYYGGFVISKVVRDTPVNEKVYEKKTKFGIHDELETYVKEIHEKFSIPYYKGRNDFINKKLDMQFSDAQLEALWIEYEHREKLIVTGQYEKIRLDMFRQNYIKGMERLGMSKAEIEHFKKLTDKQLDELIMYPRVEKGSEKSTYLPQLGLFNYDDKESLSRVRADLEEAYEAVGLETLQDENFDRYKNYKVKLSKPNKKGEQHYYIPFVGSETGRNADLVRDILEYQGII